jgi:hypothetical protein
MKKRLLEEGDELGLDWDRWADGHPHQLHRKRHLGGHPTHIVREAARNAAIKRGKVVQTLNYYGVFWVQFSDYRIRSGEPCPCGGRELVQLHPLYLRCTSCNAQLELQASTIFDESGEEPSPLDDFSDIHLHYLEPSPTGDVYRGYASDTNGSDVLLFVEFKRRRDAGGGPLTTENARERVFSLRAVPLEELEGLIDPRSLTGRSDWDLVL